MSRQVEHDGTGSLRIRFPFDRGLVDRIKTLPNRRWNAQQRFWMVPEDDVVQLVELLHADRFQFDLPTRELYTRLGGQIELAESELRQANTQPGLFDPAPTAATDPDAAPETATQEGAGHAGDLTVSQLNEEVRRVLASTFPQGVWLVGEITGFNKNAHRRHVSFQLVENSEDGRKVSEVSATLFERARADVEQALQRAGDPFQLEDEITVRVRARVELYVPWGSYRVLIEELDVNFTLGEAARRREEILRRLDSAGLLAVNSALALPRVPLRIGLITSIGSDAYTDVLRTLQESGYAFRITVHGARVQGHQTEPSVLNALDWFSARAGDFDALLICRGGGSRTDLTWFDTEPLGRAVAGCPLPVIVGIGHEQDHSVLDAVARRAKTPTAAAGLLLERVSESHQRVEDAGQMILGQAADRLRQEQRNSVERAGRLARAARNTLQHERALLDHRRQRAAAGARGMVASQREALGRWSSALPRRVELLLARERTGLETGLRGLVQACRREIAAARRELTRQAVRAAPRAQRLLDREAERVEARERRLRLADPGRVLERGFSILRAEDGAVVTDPRNAPAGAAVRAELRSGTLRLRSEGPDPERPKRGRR